jgi:hypothetical protein
MDPTLSRSTGIEPRRLACRDAYFGGSDHIAALTFFGRGINESRITTALRMASRNPGVLQQAFFWPDETRTTQALAQMN